MTSQSAARALRARHQSAGTVTSGPVASPLAYLDDVLLGDLDLLRTASRALVFEVRFIGPTDAIRPLGTGHSQGVVQVVTKPRKP